MSSHVQDQVNDWNFLEVWLDPTALPPYVLILLGECSGFYHIVDPAEDYKIIFSSSSYDEAKLWLLEDEYERVNGRFFGEVEAEEASVIERSETG